MSFDRYTGQGWELSRGEEKDVQKLERPTWSFRFTLPWSVTLNRTQDVIQSYTVVSDLPNLVPALYEPKELYFPTREVAIDPEGTVRSPIPLSEGLTYTVISEVPYRDRTLLGRSPTAYPQPIQKTYLQLPQAIAPRLRQTTEAILAESPNPLTNPYEKALYLAQYLKQNYELQPNLPFLAEDEDLVEAFLFKYQGGYPDHFSTVLTTMLRSIGIPARLTVGFGAGEFNPFTGFYVVRNTDAFALTEVYFAKHGWFSFNPIPGANVVPASVEESQVFAVLKQFWNWVAGWLPSPLSGFLNGVFEQLVRGFGWAIAFLTGLFTQGWVGLLTGLILMTALSFAGWLGWSGWQTWRYRRWLAKLPPMEALYQQLLTWLASQGMRKTSTQTPLEFARQSCSNPPAGQSLGHVELIDAISQAYVRWRYGGQAPNIEPLRQQLKAARGNQKRSAKQNKLG